MGCLRQRATGTVVLLVVSLAWSIVAACTDDAPAGEPQMACCLAGHQDCEHAAPSMECCTSPAPPGAGQQSATVKPTSSKFVPVLHLVRLVDPVPVASTSAERIVRLLDRAPARPPDTPTYLLDSVFRL